MASGQGGLGGGSEGARRGRVTHVVEKAVPLLLRAVDEETHSRDKLFKVDGVVAVAVAHAKETLAEHARQRNEAQKCVLVDGALIVRARRLPPLRVVSHVSDGQMGGGVLNDTKHGVACWFTPPRTRWRNCFLMMSSWSFVRTLVAWLYDSALVCCCPILSGPLQGTRARGGRECGRMRASKATQGQVGE